MRCLPLIPLALMALPDAAQAAAFAGVLQNSVYVSILETDPMLGGGTSTSGLIVEAMVNNATWTHVEKGNASTGAAYGGASGYGGITTSIFASADRGGYAYSELVVEGTISLKNDGPYDYADMLYKIEFSAFNPGGSNIPGGTDIGAMVDDASKEFARYFSGQFGNFPDLSRGDEHACDTRNYNLFEDYIYFTPPPAVRCGVASPDTSEWWVDTGPFLSGDSIDLFYRLTLVAEASSVPEPHPWLLFAIAAGCSLVWRSRRAKFRRISA